MPDISSPFAAAQVAPSPTREECTIHGHITANPEQPNRTITGPNGAHHEPANTQAMVLTAVHANSTNVAAAPAVNMPAQASFTINHPLFVDKVWPSCPFKSRANFALGLFDRAYNCKYLDKMDAAQAYYQFYLNYVRRVANPASSLHKEGIYCPVCSVDPVHPKREL
ncbi:hypothetical protein PCASD_02113 [Puccinia coronata f. sp. avenae]|uniref:Uncharacterized protein n=1 Tax=Puccinia coronata f. sp. avenae TaxID=200324 RepID=A0A2N5VPU0_9BASI|nr:hypothetical protein PCASD_02113 [Puccinia coronata f. sp. avenae]